MATPTTTELSLEGLLSTRAVIGRAAGGRAATTERPLYSFAGGMPDPASFPYDELVAATERMMRAEGAEALTYGDPQGYPGLRELICHKYDLFEGLKVEREQVLVTNGSGHALSLAMSAFVDVGDPVICEAPTFSGTLLSLRRHGAELHGVPVDEEGIVTAAVRERLDALRREGRPCKLIYTIVNFHNPAGPTMSRRRRQELVALAREYGTPILEDDAYGELRFEGEALPSLYALDEAGVVIRAGTLSKILGAGMRLGWLLAPRALIPVLSSFNFGGGVAPFASRVATYYLREHLQEHVATLIDIYRAKRDAMLRGLDEELAGTDAEISRPEGGFFLWIKLPTGADPAVVARLAGEARIGYVQGPAFFPDSGGKEFIRLAYSYESAERCYAGAKLLGAAIREAIGGAAA